MGYGEMINPDCVTLEFTDPENGETFHFPPKGEDTLEIGKLLLEKRIRIVRSLKKKKFRQILKYGKKHGWTEDFFERIREK